jgi:hypothetical protein
VARADEVPPFLNLLGCGVLCDVFAPKKTTIREGKRNCSKIQKDKRNDNLLQIETGSWAQYGHAQSNKQTEDRRQEIEDSRQQTYRQTYRQT